MANDLKPLPLPKDETGLFALTLTNGFFSIS
jgi:hypothetical protein